MNTKKKYPQKIGSIINSIFEEKGYVKIFKEQDVIKMWPEIVGETVAQVTECSDIKDGILYVRVLSSSWRHEISYVKAEILRQIKIKTSCDTILDIVFC